MKTKRQLGIRLIYARQIGGERQKMIKRKIFQGFVRHIKNFD